jgi:hypothetical protein
MDEFEFQPILKEFPIIQSIFISQNHCFFVFALK